jgi:hypothetical protein
MRSHRNGTSEEDLREEKFEKPQLSVFSERLSAAKERGISWAMIVILCLLAEIRDHPQRNSPFAALSAGFTRFARSE